MLKEWNTFIAEMYSKNKELPPEKQDKQVKEKEKLTFWYLEDKPEDKKDAEKKIRTKEEIA